MRRRRARANDVGQPVISIADKCAIRRRVPILGPWIIGNDPAAAGVQAFGDDAEAGAQILGVERSIANDRLEFGNKVMSIEFRDQSSHPPKRAAKYPRT